MKAIVIKQYGGPEVLAIEERPMPVAKAGQVLIEIKAFGINQAEIYFRKGSWGDVAEISGIECVGLVSADPSGQFQVGQKVFAIVGGMGRSINGSYAEYVTVSASNVAAINSNLAWEQLAAIPESYATAWSCLYGNLEIRPGQTLLIRGATSALGQAALNIAAHVGVNIIATTRNAERIAGLKALGAKEVAIEAPDLHETLNVHRSGKIDAVLDLIGNTTVLGSLTAVSKNGRVCLAGFLGGSGPISDFQPVFQIPSGRHLSVFASALATGSTEFPMDEIPFQEIVDLVAQGVYKASPAEVFEFNRIQDAHCLLESGQVNGKIVIRV
ncbi:zinc-binding dehydrogenase [Undibacterium sp. Di27W]|uniref:zinc-binding dehydrogenase n=1 Tax=Undibacterium sp. Di27W TaxID=3413036 RepID=UPI003BF2FC98